MTIGIEAERANNPFKTGVEHYAKQLIINLAKIDRVNNYILYLRTKPEAWFLSLPTNFKVKVLPFPRFWTQIRLSLEMWLHPPDVLFVPASALPFIHPKRTIVTIHDIGWRYFPQSFTWFMRTFLEWSTAFAVKHAEKIIAVSESTKEDILKFYSVKPSKISVVYHGYEKKDSKHKELSIQMPKKYILFLSTLQPRKNLGNLIQAFRLLKTQNPHIPHKLVVIGKPGWKYESIIQNLQANLDIVVYLNYVSDSERLAILSQADLLVVPSFYEGFGLPILEGLAMNVPVALSKTSSLPEVAGEAGVYFDPNNVQDISQAIASVIFDRSLAEKLRLRGKARLAQFSWEKCARETLQILSP